MSIFVNGVGEINPYLELVDNNNKYNIKEISQNYTILETDELLLCSGNITLTLPLASNSKKKIIIKNVDFGEVVVNVSGADTIDNKTSLVLYINDSAILVDALVGKWIRLGV